MGGIVFDGGFDQEIVIGKANILGFPMGGDIRTSSVEEAKRHLATPGSRSESFEAYVRLKNPDGVPDILVRAYLDRSGNLRVPEKGSPEYQKLVEIPDGAGRRVYHSIEGRPNGMGPNSEIRCTVDRSTGIASIPGLKPFDSNWVAREPDVQEVASLASGRGEAPAVRIGSFREAREAALRDDPSLALPGERIPAKTKAPGNG